MAAKNAETISLPTGVFGKHAFIQFAFVIAAVLFLPVSLPAQTQTNAEYVILLHGLARTEKSMSGMEKHLEEEGYKVHNVKYPSRTNTVENLANTVIPEALDFCRTNGAAKISFITHSMGGVITLCYLQTNMIPELGRIVMLSPPSQGSETVDKLKDNLSFKWLNGPAGRQLGTDSNSIPNSLVIPDGVDIGIITGDRSINWILSAMIPGKDDGKVSIERAKKPGMKDFLVVHSAHPFIMSNADSKKQAVYFLRNGRFEKTEGKSDIQN